MLSTSAFWQFSQCGDRLALVVQTDPNYVETSLYRTSDGGSVVQRTDPIVNSNVNLETSTVSTFVTVDGVKSVFAPNTAPAACGGSGLQSLKFSPHTVTGGSPSTGTVALSAPAGVGGAVVTLGIPLLGGATGPASVTVLAGHTTAAFTLMTSAVVSPIGIVVDATLASVTKRDTVIVQPPPGPPPTLSNAVIYDVPGGYPATLQLVLTGPAPVAGATVALTSSDTSRIKVPPTVTIPYGTILFAVPIATPITATDFGLTITSHYLAVTLVDSLHVFGPQVAALDSKPKYCLPGGAAVSFTVTMNGPALPPGNTVAITNSDPTHFSVPASVFVPASATTATFTGTSTAVSAETPVTVSAGLNHSSRSVFLSVIPPQPWALTDLGTAFYGKTAIAINDSDLVVGTNSDNGFDRAYQWELGGNYEFPTIGSFGSSSARGINNLGNVVGQSGTHAFFYDYDNDITTDLTPAATLSSSANAINDANEVAGRYNGHAFFYDGSLQDLGTLGGATSEAMAINASGTVVGDSRFDVAGGMHAFIWTSGGGMQALAIPTGMTQTHAFGINSSGVIIGSASTPGPSVGCMWVAGVPTVFISGFQPRAINDAGQMVGPEGGHLTLWAPAGRTRLDSLIAPGCGWASGLLGDADMGINNLGDVVAAVRFGDTDYFDGILLKKNGALVLAAPPPAPAQRAPIALAIAPFGANPARGRIDVRCALPRAMSATIELIDVTGRRLGSHRLDATVPGIRFVALPESNHLEPGVYFVRLTQGRAIAVTRVTLVR